MKFSRMNVTLIKSLAVNDLKSKFAGSYLGIIWAFIQPVVTVLVYWFVFEKGIKSNALNLHGGIQVPFVLWLIAGIAPWFFFQEALQSGTGTLIDYSYLVKKVVFRIEVLPVVKVLSALTVHVFFAVLVLVIFCCYGMFPGIYLLQLLYYMTATILLSLGLIYMTSAIVVFFRDLNQLISIVLQVGMWMTPIMWDVNGINLHPVLIAILKTNPMYYIVNGYRDTFINQVWFWEDIPMTIYFWLVTLALLLLGRVIFSRLRPHFADVL